mmetsp:Transcript_11868/g.41968  ORF Transcript_11868/g.41968 Transcript_11868/m.41968 type:complete len:227 (+) Transcript_11868:43-723(+)
MTWSCGDRCVIADTAYVLGRCPEIIGTIADVRSFHAASPQDRPRRRRRLRAAEGRCIYSEQPRPGVASTFRRRGRRRGASPRAAEAATAAQGRRRRRVGRGEGVRRTGTPPQAVGAADCERVKSGGGARGGRRVRVRRRRGPARVAGARAEARHFGLCSGHGQRAGEGAALGRQSGHRKRGPRAPEHVVQSRVRRRLRLYFSTVGAAARPGQRERVRGRVGGPQAV